MDLTLQAKQDNCITSYLMPIGALSEYERTPDLLVYLKIFMAGFSVPVSCCTLSPDNTVPVADNTTPPVSATAETANNITAAAPSRSSTFTPLHPLLSCMPLECTINLAVGSLLFCEIVGFSAIGDFAIASR